jgi:hypothetical protein
LNVFKVLLGTWLGQHDLELLFLFNLGQSQLNLLNGMREIFLLGWDIDVEKLQNLKSLKVKSDLDWSLFFGFLGLWWWKDQWVLLLAL